MHSLTEQIKSYMTRLSMVPRDGRILAAVSGGADSVCLLLALKEIGYDVCAVHVEHGIRGEESLADCEYVRRLCQDHSVDLRVIHIDALAVAMSESMSLEEAARAERYQAFRRAAEDMGVGFVATAHHRMDQAETILWNLIRGSSVGGLGGIRPVRKEGDITLIRPLLGCDRESIEEYLKDRGVSWCEDRTNGDTAITRNAIRLKVMPLLKTLNPGAVQHITDAAEDLRAADDYLEKETDKIFREVLVREKGEPARKDRDKKELPEGKPGESDPEWKENDLPVQEPGETDIEINRDRLQTCPEVIRLRVLRRAIGMCGRGLKDITRRHVKALDDLCMGDCGRRITLPRGIVAVSEAGILRVGKQLPGQDQSFYQRVEKGPEESADEKLQECGNGMQRAKKRRIALSDLADTQIPLTGDGICSVVAEGAEITISAEYITWEGGEVPKKKYTKYLAYDTMTPCLTVRTRRPGDYLVVNHEGGRRKLKEYLIDEKIPRDLRDSILLVAQGSHVLWVIGKRISESAKVRDGSKAVRIKVDFH